MHRLILMRHAKSSWAEPGRADFDRPLKKRGRQAAALVGRWLIARGMVPNAAVVSSARRCQETWAGVAAEIGPVPASNMPDLYHAEAETILQVILGAGDVPVLMVLGHQPGLGDAATRLLAAPPGDPEFARFPTAATAIIDFEKDVGWGAGTLVDFVIPAHLAPPED